MRDIILTGPKHCGKTSAGKALAALFSCEFIDLDDLIFQRTGKSPRELYKESPEIFQKAESEALAALGLGGGTRRVIAAGGGIIDNHEAINILANSDFVKVFLNVTAEIAWRRIESKGDLPPFLRTDNPRETHRALHERRAAAYLQLADIVIEITEDKTTVKENAGKIFDKIRLYVNKE